MASESISDGRLYVRYWKNGKDGSGGENTAWLAPSDVQRFSFDCCGDVRCSGIKAVMFRTSTYSDCFNMALTEVLSKRKPVATAAATDPSAAEIEKLKLLLEIEKLKLEREKLKQGDPN